MKSKDLENTPDVLPWRQDKSFVKSISSLPPKVAKMTQVRSKPRAAGHKYLEIYLRSMEKARLSTLGEAYARLLKGAVDGWERADRILQKSQNGSSTSGKETQRRTLPQDARPKPWRQGSPR